jgi:hypothetical protein
MDYSFFHTNQDGIPMAPTHAMQFGSGLLQRLVRCDPKWGPPLLAKIDLADGYYRVPLHPFTALRLGVTIPSDNPNSHDHLIAIPLTLPMS